MRGDLFERSSSRGHRDPAGACFHDHQGERSALTCVCAIALTKPPPMGVAVIRTIGPSDFSDRFGGGPFGSQRGGTSNFPPLVAFLIRPLLAKPLVGGSFTRNEWSLCSHEANSLHVERYSRRQFLTGISKDRWRTPLEVMFQRGSAGRSRLHDYGDRDLVDVARSVFWHARVVEVPPARFGLKTHMACFGGLCGQTVFWHRRPPNNNDIGRSVG